MRQHNLRVTGSLTVNGENVVSASELSALNSTLTGQYATTGSNMYNGNQTITGSVIVTGTITASGFTGSLSGSVFGLGNTVSFSSSVSSDLVNLESKSASVDISITNINSVTASNIARLSNLESKSSSVDISVSSLNTFSASNANQSLNQLTGSLATTGSNTFYGTQVFSGSVFIATDLIVQGSSSIQYISASSVSIGTNIVNLNTTTPSVRYAGISVQDSGSSAGITGSMLWDSLCNRWIYSNPSTIGYSGGLLMSGPRAATLGSEITLTCNYIAKSGGGDHLYDSCIWEMSGSVGINCATPSYNLDVNGCARFSGGVTAAGAIFTTTTETRGNIRTTFTSDNSYYSLFGNDGALNLDTYGVGGYMNFKILGCTKLSIASTGVATFACSVNAVDYYKVTGAGPWISLFDTQASSKNWAIRTGHDAVGDLAFRQSNSTSGDPINAGTTRLYINATGNVGIGTSTTTCRRLTIFGESTCVRGIAFRGCAAGDGGNIFLEGYDTDDNEYSNFEFVANSGNGYFAFNSGAGSNCNNWTQNTRMVIGTNGKVGIGVTNPTGSLDVSGSIYIKSSGGGVLFIPRLTDPNHGLSIGEQNTIGSKSAVIRTGGGVSEYLFIDPGLNDSNAAGNIALASATTGSVGIGTYLPLSKFHQVINDGATYVGDARFGGSSTQFGIELKYNQASTTSGSIYVSPGYSSVGVLFKLGAGSGNTNQLVLKGDGNVGIGTCNPSYKLDIAGTAYVNGSFLADSMRTLEGSVSNPYNVWTTMFTVSTNTVAIYYVIAVSQGNGLTYTTSAMVVVNDGGVGLHNYVPAGALTLQTSGYDVQVKNGSGSTMVIRYKFIKMA